MNLDKYEHSLVHFRDTIEPSHYDIVCCPRRNAETAYAFSELMKIHKSCNILNYWW